MGQSQVINGASLQRSADRGLHVVSLARTGCDEYFITAPFLEGDQPCAAIGRAAESLRNRGATIVSMVISGISFEDGFDPICESFGPVTWPVTWIDRTPNASIGGVHIWAIAGPTLSPIAQNGVVAGVRFDDPNAAFFRAGGLVPKDTGAGPADQAQSMFDAMESVLRAADMEFSDVVRTWFYNRNITDWYGDFNRVRKRFFDSHGVFQRLIPASTGVGGGDVGGTALTGGLFAVRPKNAHVRIAAVDSPMQCPATNYGSAFSRAIEVALPDHARLLVSGTASISPRGQTEHVGNVAAQVERTFEVVGTLLESRGMSWDEVTCGMAYVKRVEDIPAVRKQLERAQLDHLPILMVHADICRDDLLFELEVNAISPRAPYNHAPG